MNMMVQQGIAHIHLALGMQDFPHTGGRLIPKLRTKGNLQIGAGIKLPTGNY